VVVVVVVLVEVLVVVVEVVVPVVVDVVGEGEEVLESTGREEEEEGAAVDEDEGIDGGEGVLAEVEVGFSEVDEESVVEGSTSPEVEGEGEFSKDGAALLVCVGGERFREGVLCSATSPPSSPSVSSPSGAAAALLTLELAGDFVVEAANWSASCANAKQ